MRSVRARSIAVLSVVLFLVPPSLSHAAPGSAETNRDDPLRGLALVAAQTLRDALGDAVLSATTDTPAQTIRDDVVAAGDLTGDGLVDLLRVARDVDFETGGHSLRVEGRQGSTGETIWSYATPAPAVAAFVLTAGDLSGDRVPDFLVYTLDVDPALGRRIPDPFGSFPEPEVYVLSHAVVAINGAKGAPLWRASAPGAVVEVREDVYVFPLTWDSPLASAVATAGEALLWIPAATPDLDGDGAGDVLLVSRSSAADLSSWERVGFRWAEPRTSASGGLHRTQAKALSGIDGDLHWIREMITVGPGARITPAGGDLTGDGRADVVAWREVGFHASDAYGPLVPPTSGRFGLAEAFDGATGRTVWVEPIAFGMSDGCPDLQGSTEWRGLPDSTGDGRPELALLLSSPRTHCALLLDGASGDRLGRPISGFGERDRFEPAGDLTGDGRMDFVQASLPFSFDGSFLEGGLLQSVNGATGDLISAFVPPPWHFLVDLADFDGDGRLDALYQSYVALSPEGGDGLRLAVYAVSDDESGRRDPTWKRDVARPAGAWMRAVPAGGALTPGGGATDVLVAHERDVPGVPQRTHLLLRALDGATGGDLWSAPEAASTRFDRGGFTLAGVGDVDGDGASDLAWTAQEGWPTVTSRLGVASGAGGAPVWAQG